MQKSVHEIRQGIESWHSATCCRGEIGRTSAVCKASVVLFTICEVLPQYCGVARHRNNLLYGTETLQVTPLRRTLQCFDTVGWAAGRASGL